MGQRNPPNEERGPDPVLERLQSVRRGVDAVRGSVEDVQDVLTTLATAERRDRRVYQLDFSTSIDSNTDETDPAVVEREIPFDGYVTSVYVDIPDVGSDEVGLTIKRDEGERLFPRNKETNFLKGDGLEGPFPTRTPVEEEREIEAHYINTDGGSSHRPVVLVTIEERLESDPVNTLDTDEE